MGKLCCFLLVLSLLCGSFALAGTEDVIGQWYLAYATQEEQTLRAADFDLSAALNLKKGGKAEWTIGGETKTATWQLKKNTVTLKLSKSQALVFTLVDGVLTFPMGDFVMHMTRELPPQREEVPLTKAIAAETVDPFQGNWGSAFVVDPLTGKQLALSAMGVDIRLEIAGDLVCLYANGEGVPLTCRLVDGALTTANESSTITLTRHESDLLALTINDQTFYLVKLNI